MMPVHSSIGSLSISSSESQAVGTGVVLTQFASSWVLPDPAGATTSVSGNDVTRPSSSSNLGRGV